MLKAALVGRECLDLCPLSDDRFVAPVVDLGGCDVIQAPVGPCCTNRLRVSLFQSSLIDGVHEQLGPYKILDNKP